MQRIEIEGGTLTANAEDRTVSGRILKFGEEGQTNLGRLKVPSTAFTYPTDPSMLYIADTHAKPVKAIGHALLASVVADDGYYATFRIDEGERGDALLAAWAAGDTSAPRKLSIEVDGVKIRGGVAVGGIVHGVALVDKGAFPSSTLLAEDTPDEAPPAADDIAEVIDEATTPESVTVATSAALPESVTVTAPDGTTATYTPNEEPPTMNASAPAAPATLLANGTPPVTTEQRSTRVHLPSLFAALSRARLGMHDSADATLLATASPRLAGDPENIAATLLAALTDLKVSGEGSLPVGGGAIRENWVGQIDQGIAYERQFVPLAKTGTDISAAGKKGYSVHRGTAGSPINSYATASRWAGNKENIASGQGFTKPFESTLHRFAFGNDIAREYIDLPGGEEVLAAYFALIKEDHLVWSDELARLAWLELAGLPIAVSGAIPSEYPAALGVVMQALRAVAKPKADKRRDKASFVIVNDEAAEAIDFTPFEHIPEFIKFSWNLDRSDLKAGDVVLVNGDNGISGSPAALAGAGYALELDELAGGPLWIDALEISKGGIDRAVHGYLQEFQVRPEAVSLVGTVPTRANSTTYAEGALIKVSSVVYRVTIAGTSHTAAPTAPSVGATVADGTATLLRLV